MRISNLWYVGTFLCLLVVVCLFPEFSLAQSFGGSAFENRLTGLTHSLMTVVLPAVSILGLVYAAILAAMGDEGSKKRMVLVIIASVVGFLAPLVIKWFQAAVGA